MTTPTAVGTHLVTGALAFCGLILFAHGADGQAGAESCPSEADPFLSKDGTADDIRVEDRRVDDKGPPREGFLPGAAGAELHYRVLGSASDTAVVLHGGPGAGMHSVLSDWEALAEELTLVFYDQRGGGRSTLPADTSLLHARCFVEDLEAVRRHFGFERLKLITHSFGSILAARYAETYPDRVERMVFHGATGPRRAEARRLARASPPSPDTVLSDRMRELLATLLRGTADDPVETCLRYEALGRRLAEARGEPAPWRGTTCEAPPEAVRYYYRYTAQLAPRTFGDWDFTTGLEHLDAPLLVIHGARDSAALAEQHAWVEAVPRGRLLAIPGASKGAVAYRPDVVLPAVASFLRGEWPARAEEVPGGHRQEPPLGEQSTERSHGTPSRSLLEPQDTTARRGEHVDVYHGVRVPDPYRWMEEMEAPETRRWIEAEDRRARDLVGETEVRDSLRREISRTADVRRFRPPWKRGERLFYLTYRSSGGPGTVGTQLHLREGEGSRLRAGGEDRVLVAQADLPEGSVLTRIVPGPLGKRVAYGVARDGSRWETLRVFDVESGRTLDDRLEGVNTGASTVVWTPDGSGFYYERFNRPADADERTARLQNERVLFHVAGTDPASDTVVHASEDPESGLTVGLTDDGRHLVVTERDPSTGYDRVLVADRHAQDLTFRPLVDEPSVSYRLVGDDGDELWFETDRDAPNRKVVRVDLAAAGVTGSDAAPSAVTPSSAWHDVVAEAPEAINTWLGARKIGRHLVVGYLVDARTEWRVFDLEGRRLHTLELPRLGPVWSGFHPSVGPDETETFYSLSGLVDPGSIYRLDLRTGSSTLFARPELGHDPDEFVTRQVFYEGRDGTRIPMYLVHRRGLERDGRSPLIMYAYGFGGWSAEPWFQPHLAVWLRRGGIWAVPNIRGGGEYGEAWRRAGSGRNKQTGIDDFLAAAEWLLEEGYTSRKGLVLNASSAGGAVGGGALAQRPELFGAAVLDYPVLDMLNYERFTGAASWRRDFGTVEDPEDFEALLGYSPYHNLRLHRCYPPTMVSPGELDEVTPPFHAYKFVAALRHAQGCEEPILLRVTWGAGHSSGAAAEDAAETWADQLAFLARVLELASIEAWRAASRPFAAAEARKRKREP